MSRSTSSIVALFVLSAMAAGCASTLSTAPAETAPTTADCRQLITQIAQTEGEKRAARVKEKEAWKAIVPFAVMARYTNGKSAAEKADQKLEALRAESQLRGCTPDGI